MRTLKIGGKTLEIYDSIDELPIRRFHKFNKYMLVDSGIGSDLNSINDHIAKTKAYISKSDNKKAFTQLENLRQSLYLISQETSIKHLSFVALIKSVDGKDITDISDGNMKRILSEINTVKKGFFENIIDDLKKKLENEIRLYFPSHFDDSVLKEYYNRVKLKVLLQLESIIKEVDNTDKIERIDDFLLSLSNPKIFFGKDSAEIQYDKQFEDMCLYLTQELSINVDNMNVLQFYNSFEYLKKKNK